MNCVLVAECVPAAGFHKPHMDATFLDRPWFLIASVSHFHCKLKATNMKSAFPPNSIKIAIITTTSEWEHG